MKLLKKILTLGGLLSKKKAGADKSKKSGRKQVLKVKGGGRNESSCRSGGEYPHGPAIVRHFS